jgi:adenosylmethionine-8-amino-7-oxononanoate aminotransferase
MPKVPAPLSYRFPSGFDRESYALSAAEALEEEILAQGPETVLAFILEPVGGLSTGALVAPEGYYLKIREICDRYGVLLIYDEVMSGAGRTGAFLAAHHWPDARPDLVVLAKGIGAGYTPLGIFLAPEDFVETLVRSGGFQHGHTYNANPLTCAVGLAVLQEVEERGLIENAKVMGELLAEQLGQVMAASPIVGDLRGKGLLLALEIVADKASKAMLPADCNALPRIVAIAREEGLLLYTRRTNEGRFGEWLMIAPPLIVSAEEVGVISEGLGRVLARYCDELSGAGLL